MSTMQIIEGSILAEGRRFAVVAARFNAFVVEHLVTGALDTLKRHGAREEDLLIVRVPGAFEMPVVVHALAQSKRYDAIIALGAIIRGATPHFDYIAGECTKGLGKAAVDSLVPVAFGVLTVDSVEQAIERAGTKAGNKGAEAALTAIEMANVMRELHG